jgi:putative membrane protein
VAQWRPIYPTTLFTAPNLDGWSIFIGTLIGYIFLTIQKLGLSLINPFDEIPTGIPLNSITRTIEINLLETLKEKDIPEKITSVKDEYIM